MVQVDGNNMQLKFNMPGQNKKAVTIEEFKKLCGSSPRLYDVMKYKGKLMLDSLVNHSVCSLA